MEDKKTDHKKVASWDTPILGALLLLAGAAAFIKGITAYQTGVMIPPTTKSSWMTGPQAMVVGAIMVVVGIGLLLMELKKRKH